MNVSIDANRQNNSKTAAIVGESKSVRTVLRFSSQREFLFLSLQIIMQVTVMVVLFSMLYVSEEDQSSSSQTLNKKLVDFFLNSLIVKIVWYVRMVHYLHCRVIRYVHITSDLILLRIMIWRNSEQTTGSTILLKS